MATPVTEKLLLTFQNAVRERSINGPYSSTLAETYAGLDAVARAVRDAALEEAAQRIEPNNPESDWTEYARDCARLAGTIRNLKTTQTA